MVKTANLLEFGWFGTLFGDNRTMMKPFTESPVVRMIAKRQNTLRALAKALPESRERALLHGEILWLGELTRKIAATGRKGHFRSH